MRRLCGFDLAKTRVSRSSLHRGVSLRQAERAVACLPQFLHFAIQLLLSNGQYSHRLGILSFFSTVVVIMSLAYPEIK